MLWTIWIRPIYILTVPPPPDSRNEMVQKFQSGQFDFFLISLKAGGAGLNLTQADYVLHMDPWWNPAVEDQATDRAHRMGQTQQVTVYRFISRSTVEEKILSLHSKKRHLIRNLLRQTDQPLSEIAIEELLFSLCREIRPKAISRPRIVTVSLKTSLRTDLSFGVCLRWSTI